MKSLTSLVAVIGLLLPLAGAWAVAYEDDPRVMKLAASGDIKIKMNHINCDGIGSLTDKLGGGKGVIFLNFCVKREKLPRDVLSEVIQMEKDQLENYSDYDQRIVKLYVLRQNQLKANKYIPTETIQKIARAVGVPFAISTKPNIQRYRADRKNLEAIFSGLYVGEKYVEKPQSTVYLANKLHRKKVIEVTFGDGVELYPGGGFGVTFYLFITDNEIVYVKKAGWDS